VSKKPRANNLTDGVYGRAQETRPGAEAVGFLATTKTRSGQQKQDGQPAPCSRKNTDLKKSD
jgi:hypothetical protein